MAITFVHALLEGAADEPVIAEILSRRFGLRRGCDFSLHPHQGKGRLPDNPEARPDPGNRTLLHLLPAKLRALSDLPADQVVLVVVDADDTPPADLLAQLERMLRQLSRHPPAVLFRLAVEETESWFLADVEAIRKAYTGAKIKLIETIPPDAVVGAWERLAACLGRRGQAAPKDKFAWATHIAPHMNLESPRSPSLAELLNGLAALGLGKP